MKKSGMALSRNAFGQFLNLPAVWSTLKLLTKPSLAVPQITATSLSQLSVQEIQNRGIKYIVFDKDNTLCLPFDKLVHPSVQEKLQEIQAVYPSRCVNVCTLYRIQFIVYYVLCAAYLLLTFIRMIPPLNTTRSRIAILSNSIGSSDDVNYEAAAACEAAVGINVIRHVTKKPGVGCFHEVVLHFQKYEECLDQEKGVAGGMDKGETLPGAARPTSPSPGRVTTEQICVIGDRVLTDIVFANRYGMHSILVSPLTETLNYSLSEVLKVDNVAAVVFRSFELTVLLPFMKMMGVKALEVGTGAGAVESVSDRRS